MATTTCGIAVPNPRKTYTIKITAGNRKRSILLVGFCSTNTFSFKKSVAPLAVCLNPLITDMLKLFPALPGPIRRPPPSLLTFAQAFCITVINACCTVQQGLASCRSAVLHYRVQTDFVFLCTTEHFLCACWVSCSVVCLARHLKCSFSMCLLS